MATYFDDCSSLSGWTERSVGAGTQFEISSGTIAVLGSAYTEALYLNSCNSDADRDDAELLIKYKTSTFSSTHLIGIVRGSDSGSSTTMYGYIAAVRTNAVRIYKCVNSTPSLVTGVSTTCSNDTYYWIRLRVNASSLYIRIWADGSSEQGTWDLDGHSDTDVTAAGYIGLFNYNNTNHYWNGCGVGTNGDTAPASGGGGGGLSIPIAMSNYLRQMGS